MIASTAKGLYITRFWYTRTVHPRDVVVTGMTRDGTYRIENGEIAGAVKSLRFTQSYVKALAAVEALSAARKTLLAGLAVCVPAVKLTFSFSSSTR
jgi:predicted Zn-dependent protease